MRFSAKLLILVLIFRVLLDSATERLAFYWSDTGIVYQPVSGWLVVISFLALLLPFPFLYKKHFSPSSFCFQLLYIYNFIPVTSQFAVNSDFELMPLLLVTLCFVVFGIIVHIPQHVVLKQRRFSSYRSLFVLFIVGWMLSYGLLIVEQGLPTAVPNILDSTAIYAFRETVEFSTIVSYAITWQTLILNITLIGYGLLKRSPLLVLCGVGMQVLSFAFTGMKFQIFGTILYLVLAFGILKFKEHFPKFMLFVLIFSVTTGEILDYQFGLAPAVQSIVARRTFVVPAQIHFYWYSYFTTHKWDFFAQNYPFKFFYSTEYNMGLSDEIGSHFYSAKAPPHCNVNVFADAYANFGVIGMLFVTLLLGVFLKLCDMLVRNKNKFLALSCLAMPMMNFGASNFFTNLISGGAIFSLIVVYLLPYEVDELALNAGENSFEYDKNIVSE